VKIYVASIRTRIQRFVYTVPEAENDTYDRACCTTAGRLVKTRPLLGRDAPPIFLVASAPNRPPPLPAIHVPSPPLRAWIRPNWLAALPDHPHFPTRRPSLCAVRVPPAVSVFLYPLGLRASPQLTIDAGAAKTCAPGGFARRALDYYLQSPSKLVVMRSGSTRLAIVPCSHPLHDNDSGKDRVPQSPDTTALGVPSTKHLPLPPASGTEGGGTDNLDSPDDGGADTAVALPQVKGAAVK